MTRRFLIESAYVAGIVAVLFYILLALVWIGTAIIADTSGGALYKSLDTPIDDCRNYNCVTIIEKNPIARWPEQRDKEPVAPPPRSHTSPRDSLRGGDTFEGWRI